MTVKTRRIIIIVMTVIVLSFFLTMGLREYNSNYKKTVVFSSTYDDYSIRIYMIGTPVFPYGETSCRIDLFKNGKRINQQSLSLLNDGAVVTKDNFTVEWDEEYVRIYATATEQNDVDVTLAL